MCFDRVYRFAEPAIKDGVDSIYFEYFALGFVDKRIRGSELGRLGLDDWIHANSPMIGETLSQPGELPRANRTALNPRPSSGPR
ncbi:hypothetical protein D3C86_2098610 [compost metagenome]